MSDVNPNNLDSQTVAGFGDEWQRFDQTRLTEQEKLAWFSAYFQRFPWHRLSQEAIGFDMGCGSGRWAQLAAKHVGRLYCFDASLAALSVAKTNLKETRNAFCAVASVGAIPLRDASMDFGYSLGVLHHVPDTAAGLKACAEKLKPGAPFLVYLYYRFDNRPTWYRLLWRGSDFCRKVISRCPTALRYTLSQILAAVIYFPLARLARAFERLGAPVALLPLSGYRNASFYTMRTDALDRFGTRLEHRYTADEIRQMLQAAGFDQITISDTAPYWCAVGYKL